MHLNNIGHSIPILNIYICKLVNNLISQFKLAYYYKVIFFDKTLN